jgi:hypothetical protein
VGSVVTARSRRDLRTALAGLSVGGLFDGPVHSGLGGLVGQARRALLVVLTGAYVVFTFTLLLVLVLTVLIHGLATSDLLVFLIDWVVPTYLVLRLWRRKARLSS